MTLGNRIAVFNQGRIEQVGAPMDLYRQPSNKFVAEFLGSPKINMFPYQWDPVSLEPLLGIEKLRLNLCSGAPFTEAHAGGAYLGVRPEFIQLASEGQGLPGVIEFFENLGDVMVVYARVAGLSDLVRIKLPPEALEIHVGRKVGLVLDRSRTLIFHTNGQRVC
jgi:ABC-type sugar transport system ATPase subunit